MERIIGLNSKTVLLPQLRELCRLCGLSSTGTKSLLFERLQFAQTNLVQHPTVISIDLGYKNFATAVVQVNECNSSVLAWTKEDLHLPETFDPRQFAQASFELASRLKGIAQQFRDPIFLIERQRHRSMGAAAIPEIIINITRLEVQLHCFLLDHFVASIDPKRVAFTFDLQSGAQKKKDAIRLVKDVIAQKALLDNKVLIPSDLVTYFEQQKKQDDLSDALLQAIAYISWNKNRGNLHKLSLFRLEGMHLAT